MLHQQKDTTSEINSSLENYNKHNSTYPTTTEDQKEYLFEYNIGGLNHNGNFKNIDEFNEDDYSGEKEAYRSIFIHSDEIQKYYSNHNNSVKLYKGAVSAKELVIDFDGSDLDKVKEEFRRFLRALESNFDVDLKHVRINFSGNKGFHLRIPAVLFGGFEESTNLPKIHKQIAIKLAEGFDYLDSGIYFCLGFIRIVNTVNKKSERVAIPLTSAEFFRLSMEDIKELASSPRQIDYLDDSELEEVPLLVELKEEASKNTPSQKKKTLKEKLTEGATPGNRHDMLAQILGGLIRMNFDEDMALEFARTWNQLNEPPKDDSDIVKQVKEFYDRYNDAEKICEGFFSIGKDPYQAKVIGDSFSLRNIGKSNFLIKTQLSNNKYKDHYWDYLVNDKDIHEMQAVNYQSDFYAEKSFYRFDKDEEFFDVFIAPKKYQNINDNEFIEYYLEETFGKYKDFIKEWLAVYFYTNYKKLPALILKGKRGTGKNTFAESIAEIFPKLSEIAKDINGNFNSYAEKKLLLIDESIGDGVLQYQTLKKLSGQGNVPVNKKYKEQYSVKNNLNLIILSNEHIPVFVESEELPTDERLNQFFVYEMPKLNNEIDPEFQKKLRDRWYPYIKTELKTVFDKLDFSGKRYSINVPITDEEKDLFGDNVTELDYDVDRLVQKYVAGWDDPNSMWKKYIENNFLPNIFIDNFSNVQHRRSSVIKNMKSRGYLKAGKVERIQIDNKREYGHYFGPRFKEELNKIKPQSVKPTPKPMPLFEQNTY